MTTFAFHRHMKTTAQVLTLASAMALATGCYSSTTGNEGNLEFRYTTTDSVGNFNKPLAVGAKLELRVYDAGTSNAEATIEEVSSSDPSILEVSKGGGNTIIVEAVGDGSARVEVTATVNGASETDSIDMLGRVPEVLTAYHLCREQSDRTGYYLTGQEAFVPFDMKLSDGQDVIGYGYYPVSFDPDAAITVDSDSTDQDFIRLELGDEAGEVTMSSDIDDTTLTFQLVAEADIDGAELADPGVAEVGQTELFQLLPTTAGNPICQARATFDVTSDTPEVCDVRPLAAGEEADAIESLSREVNWIEVEGKAAGECAFTATYPEGNGGMGASASLTVNVIEDDGAEE